MSRKRPSADPLARSKLALACVTRARKELLLDEPFYGVCALRLELVEDNTCDTMWTDGVRIGYNVDYVLETPYIEAKGVVVHEVMHVANGHPWRRGNRDPELWNEACDLAINPNVLKAGFALPNNVLLEMEYAGLPAEIIYNRLLAKLKSPPPKPKPKPGEGEGEGEGEPDKQDGESKGSAGSPDGDKEGKPGNSGEPSDANEGEQPEQGSGAAEGDKSKSASSKDGKGTDKKPVPGEVRDAPADVDHKQLAGEWKVAVAQAETAAKSRGNMPGYLQEMIDGIKKPVIDWREVLWQFVQQAFVSPDYQWKMPNRRYMAMGTYLPALIGEQMPPMVVARDTSASMPVGLLEQAYAELQAIVEQMKPEVTYAVDADSRVADVMEIFPGDEFKYDAKGRGGTDFRPVFNWVRDEDIAPCCLIYITDMDGDFPEEEPDYPVLWISPPNSPKAPWGIQITMPF